MVVLGVANPAEIPPPILIELFLLNGIAYYLAVQCCGPTPHPGRPPHPRRLGLV